jgi:hypothetical protein
VDIYEMASSEALSPEILRGGETPARRFDPKSAAPFVNKSVSKATRRTYGRTVREFLQSAGMKHPSEVVPADILLWRDRLQGLRPDVSEVCSLRASSIKWSHGRWTMRCKVKGGREEV